MQHAKELAIFFGPKQASFIRQDDKAHIPSGITRLLMSLKYEFQLPDHDFVIASKHKLTPMVIGLREMQDTPVADRTALKYSGPTVIQVKPLKHTPSNASIEIKVLDSMLRSEEMCKTDGEVTKPILILTRDGHDGPRFPATRQTLAKIFIEHDLDFIYCVCNAPGLSAYHFIERRMAPLSTVLAEVILPHDNFGLHLDSSRNTMDAELEMKNFQKAGELLCKLWNDVQIDNHIVKCTYGSPTDESMEIEPLTAE